MARMPAPVEEFTRETPEFVAAVRAAIAEAGFNPADVIPGDNGAMAFILSSIPPEVAWRALTTAGRLAKGAYQLCYSCTLEWWLVDGDRPACDAVWKGCEAAKPFERCCGRVVSDWPLETRR